MKTDLKSIATQLRTFFRTSRYEVYFKKCEADTLSASRNLSTPIRDRTAPEISFIYKEGYFITCLKSFTWISGTN